MQNLGLSGAALLVAASIITANAQTNQNVGSSQTNTIPTGTIKLINVPFSQVLPPYASIAGVQLDIKQLGKLPTVFISLENKKPVAPSQAVQLCDKVFYDHTSTIQVSVLTIDTSGACW